MDKSRGSKSAEVQRVREVYDDRLQYMARPDALQLNESLLEDDVSLVLGWSGLGLPRPPWLMPIGLRVALFLSGAWSWGVVVHGFVWSGWVGPRFVRRVVMFHFGSSRSSFRVTVSVLHLKTRDRLQMARGILCRLVSARSWVLGSALLVESVGSKQNLHGEIRAGPKSGGVVDSLSKCDAAE